LKLKIVSDGTRAGTKVVNEDGAEVEGVTDIKWEFSQEEGGVWATFTVGDAPCEVAAQAPQSEKAGGVL
jgi:hypothetical protein